MSRWRLSRTPAPGSAALGMRLRETSGAMEKTALRATCAARGSIWPGWGVCSTARRREVLRGARAGGPGRSAARRPNAARTTKRTIQRTVRASTDGSVVEPSGDLVLPRRDAVVPRLRGLSGGDFLHRDAPFHRAHHRAEVAADALDFVHQRHAH